MKQPVIAVAHVQSGKSRQSVLKRPVTLVCLLSMLGGEAFPATDDPTLFSLEELMSIEVTSVAKKSQRLGEAASAISVITNEEIRRSGMTSIPELLRLVPGMNVSRIDGNKWAISARGGSTRFSNKLLVLMDGRTLYTPLFSGVFWDMQDTNLEDIERIEVIRGPGGTVWGANAVNGVINIITKSADDTLGGYAVTRTGDEENGVTVRYGGQLAESVTGRVYVKYRDQDEQISQAGIESKDADHVSQAGFRIDLDKSKRDKMTIQGDVFDGRSDQTTPNMTSITGGSVLTNNTVDKRGFNLIYRWKRLLEDDSDWELSAIADHYERNEIFLNEEVDTFNFLFRHRFHWREQHEIIWGVEYRHSQDNIQNTFSVSFTPASLDMDLYGGFVQDEIRLTDKLKLTVGSKFESNDFSGFEYQPSLRLAWEVDHNHFLWGAISRAVRTPSRVDTDARINVTSFPSPFDPDGPGPLTVGTPTLFSILGNKSYQSEDLLAYELGYRGQFNDKLSLDAAVFYNRYQHLSSTVNSFSIETAPSPVHVLASSQRENNINVNSYGLELSTTYLVNQDWRLTGGFSLLRTSAHLQGGSTDVSEEVQLEDGSPRHQWSLISRWDASDTIDVDMGLFYVDDIQVNGLGGKVTIPDYVRLDTRIAWRPYKNLEFSLVGQNLLDSQHPEFETLDTVSSEVERSAYIQAQVRF